MTVDEYYYALKHAQPIKTDEVKHPIRTALIKTDARGLYTHAQVVLDTLESEIFPDTASALIMDWERALAIVPPSGATLVQRRAAVWSKWGGGLGTSTRDLRRALAPLLNPTTAFQDLFGGDAGAPAWRWWVDEQNGSILLDGSGHMVVQVIATADADWAFTPLALIGVVDRADPVTLEADVTTVTVGTDTRAGLVVLQDADNAIFVSVAKNGGTSYLQVDRVDEGVVTEEVWTGTAPTAPFVLTVRVDAEHVTVLVDAVQKCSVDRGLVSWRYVGAFVHNETATKNAAALTLAAFRYSHDKAEGNVELIEKPLAIVPAENPEEIFAAFVHREPTDPGSYNLAEAQRTLDRMKLGHTLITVGESDWLLCDDPYSLTDRDVLGE